MRKLLCWMGFHKFERYVETPVGSDWLKCKYCGYIDIGEL